MNHMQTQEKKFIVIYEIKNLSYVDLTTLFEKLQEHEMEVKMITQDEKDNEKRRKSITFKVKKTKDSNFDEDITLLFKI